MKKKKSVNSFSSLFRNPTFLIDTNTMKATHQCGLCLKKTIDDCAEDKLPEGMVLPNSECGPRPFSFLSLFLSPVHTWNKIGNCVTPF